MKERIVVITGASGGLGTAMTEAFLRTGDIVYGISRKGEGPTDARFHAVAADLTSSNVNKEVVAHIVRTAKRIDVVVHVLGGFAGGTPIAGTDDDTWAKMMSMNVNSAFYFLRAAIPHIPSGGRIVAIGSRAGVLPSANIAAYSASKAALNALIISLSQELKDKSITANVLLPSTIDTSANRSWGSPEEQAKWVKPESIANQAVWLASPEAADISGALIPVYGRA